MSCYICYVACGIFNILVSYKCPEFFFLIEYRLYYDHVFIFIFIIYENIFSGLLTAAVFCLLLYLLYYNLICLTNKACWTSAIF